MRRLDGKVALVSGTAGDHGRAVALRFAAEGALVVGGDLLHEEAVETQRLIAREGGIALTAGPLGVTDEGSLHRWVEDAVDAFGGIDIVYANTGAVRFGSVDGRPDCGFALRAEQKSVWLTAHAAWSHLVRSRGCILTDSWRRGVIELTWHIAVEGAPHGIRANSVGPGVLDAAVYLASDEASHISGTHLVVDGGRSAVTPGAAH
ncbi:SDR family NAD(P)-dependent oxidoreductase [Streptomyces himalayensis]|uniref:SDR family oxidoreductase n=1 Tax=Streptomyces himalayensis subsp. himalayensis TaxID=2756131 RepID=A0A7W0I9A9_9ACTN|nr:SDR family oxidoreductase [Streptomyces himalayensis]MBA2946849.1 SDR family oxidoreductase [Streptomyces himalayensis subsp. himalayensis]